MGAPKKADWREERRKRAWKLKEEGWQQKDIAVALGGSRGAVSQWLKRGREGGIEALKAHPPKGMTPRLTTEQKAQIPELLARGAEAYGFRGDVWTARRVAEVIYRTFGVRYHRDHVGRLLRETGWSRVPPIERASQRDEEAISGITLDGRLFLQVRPASYDAAAVVGFLRVLLRKLPGKIIVIWDGSPIHRGHEINATWITCLANLFARVSTCATKRRSFGVVHGNVATGFSFLITRSVIW